MQLQTPFPIIIIMQQTIKGLWNRGSRIRWINFFDSERVVFDESMSIELSSTVGMP